MKGPSFLGESPETWPDLPTLMEPNEADKELTKAPPIIVRSLLSVSQPVPTPGISAIMKLTQYSSLRKLLRVTALV